MKARGTSPIKAGFPYLSGIVSQTDDQIATTYGAIHAPTAARGLYQATAGNEDCNDRRAEP